MFEQIANSSQTEVAREVFNTSAILALCLIMPFAAASGTWAWLLGVAVIGSGGLVASILRRIPYRIIRFVPETAVIEECITKVSPQLAA